MKMLKAITGVSLPKLTWTSIVSMPKLNNLGIGLIGFFLARAVIMGELYPFGISFLAAICVTQIKYMRICLLGLLVGLFSVLSGWTLLGYLLSSIVVFAVLHHYQKRESYLLIVPFLVLSIHLLARGTTLLISGYDLYQWVGVVFESLFMGVLTLVAMVSIPSFVKAIRGELLTAEERTSLGLIMLGVLVGVGQAHLFGLGIQSIISRYLVLWAAFLGGPGGGAAVGVVVGLMPSIQGTLTTGPVTFFALAGLLGGIFNSFQKIGVLIGFTLANLILTLFFTEQILILQSLKETGVALLLFLVVPIPITNKAVFFLTAKDKQDNTLNQSYMVEKIKKLGELFSELQKVFTARQSFLSEHNEISQIFDQVGEKVCKDCSLYRICWEQDFFKTYRALMDACGHLEKKGTLTEKDFGTIIKRRCMRLRELSGTISSQMELLTQTHQYAKQLEGCTNLVHQQLGGLAKVVDSFAEELKNEVTIKADLQEYLLEKLHEKGIHLQDLQIIQYPDGEKEIIIKGSCEDFSWCRGIVAPNISQILGKTYRIRNDGDCHKKLKAECTYRLVPGGVYHISVGKAQCAKNTKGISGDVCLDAQLSTQRQVLVMSDGMGTGEEAYIESNTAVELLVKLLEAGFSPETAVKTVNTVLYLRSGKENFVTLDVILINKVNGQADVIKMGGAPTIIYSKNGLKVIQSSAGPAGILEQLEMQKQQYTINPGDIIMMMSDGVWESLHQANGPSGWFEEVLTRIKRDEPQKIAEYLLYLAKKASGNQISDDMCIQIACIEQENIA